MSCLTESDHGLTRSAAKRFPPLAALVRGKACRWWMAYLWALPATGFIRRGCLFNPCCAATVQTPLSRSFSMAPLPRGLSPESLSGRCPDRGAGGDVNWPLPEVSHESGPAPRHPDVVIDAILGWGPGVRCGRGPGARHRRVGGALRGCLRPTERETGTGIRQRAGPLARSGPLGWRRIRDSNS
ncbi:hypothetical protein SMALA_3732 [Streptomyces malaysiensis subsp. malaysiensis]|nr:hypothetical protein SMALA_3732 [Streptomyces malaysiensis]